MKTILGIVLILLFSVSAFSQTELIAYKSHSGNMAHFKLTGYDNLGEPPIFIDSIIKLNDTTIVEYLSWGGNDTVQNHPVCKMSQASLDSLKGSYYDYSIRFINFEPTLEVNTDTLTTDSLVKTIETFGEEEVEEENVNLVPVVEDNSLPPSTPESNSIVVVPSSKLYILWFGIAGIILVSISVFWLKFRPKLQV